MNKLLIINPEDRKSLESFVSSQCVIQIRKYI